LGTDVKGSVAGLETRLKRATGSLALIYVTPANYRTCAAAFRPSCRSASRARVASAILSFPLPSWERVARIELARYEPDEGERTLGDLGKETLTRPRGKCRSVTLSHKGRGNLLPRHGRACPGHLESKALCCLSEMPATSAGMTMGGFRCALPFPPTLSHGQIAARALPAA
jgi:hypothetical protein